MILEPGCFIVRDYRKAIPDWVKVAVAMRMVLEGRLTEEEKTWKLFEFARDLQYDHNPSLNSRQYDTEAGDFIPAQNDPNYIFATRKPDHLHKTTGRKPGAAKTVTTRGSDVGEAKRIKKIKANYTEHQAVMAAKAGRLAEARKILLSIPKRRKKPKRKIPNRPWPKRK